MLHEVFTIPNFCTKTSLPAANLTEFNSIFLKELQDELAYARTAPVYVVKHYAFPS